MKSPLISVCTGFFQRMIAGILGVALMGFAIVAPISANETTTKVTAAKTRTAVPAPVVPKVPIVGMKSGRLQQLQSLVDSKGWLKDPFRYLQKDMVDVIEDLVARDTHTPAEVTEPKILSRLDVLIEMLEKQCKKAGGGNPNSPLMRSVLAGGPGGQGDLNAPRNSRRKWAELTPKERERILQSKTEGFPPGYEEILAEYFRRLATEESVRAIAPGTAPGTAAATTSGAGAAPAKSASDKTR